MTYVYQINPKKNPSIFSSLSLNTWLIIINVAVFIISLILISIFGEQFWEYIALKPSNVFQGKYLWTILTSMFMHGSFFHLLVNMLSLFFIGTLIEKIIGRKRYIWFYLFSGIFAGIFYCFLAYFFGGSLLGAKIFSSPDTIAVGASGAIFGLAGLLAVLIPKKKVYLIAGPLIAIIIQSIISAAFPSAGFNNALDILVTIYIFIAIFSMFSFGNKSIKIGLPIEMPFWLLPIIAIVPLVIIGLFIELPIGNTAHLGGIIIGLLYGWFLRVKFKKKTAMIRDIFR